MRVGAQSVGFSLAKNFSCTLKKMRTCKSHAYACGSVIIMILVKNSMHATVNIGCYHGSGRNFELRPHEISTFVHACIGVIAHICMQNLRWPTNENQTPRNLPL